MIDARTTYGLDNTGATDNSAALASMAAALNAIPPKALPGVVFTEGDYAFSVWPTLALSNLQLVADGDVRLHHTGSGDALTFGNDNLNVGTYGMRIDGFRLSKGPDTRSGVVLRAVHNSDVRNLVVSGVKTQGSGAWCGIDLLFCMCTELHRPQVYGWGSGIVFDFDPRWPNLPCAVCRVIQPTINGCANGLVFKSGNFNYVSDVNLEGNAAAINFESVGAGVNPAGHNTIERGDLEQNTVDVVINGPAHNNRIVLSGNPHVQNNALFLGNVVIIDA